MELADGQTIAIDSFKIRAQNSLKNNLNQNKIDRHKEYIDNKIAEYETLLDQADNEDDREELSQKISLQQKRKTGGILKIQVTTGSGSKSQNTPLEH